jgi:hypothetical protein
MMENKHAVKEYGSLREFSKKSYGLQGWKRVIREKGSAILLKALSVALRLGGERPEFETVNDGDSITVDWKEQGLLLGCCDCGLVHFIDFNVIDKILVMTLWRNEEETEKNRKRKGVEVSGAGDGE